MTGDPRLTLWLARERAADLRRTAERRRQARPEPSRQVPRPQPTVILRIACPDDALALAWLAELDGARPLAGRVLVAESAGSVAAALSLSDFRTVANPFEPTAALVQLLRVRARQLLGCEEETRRPRLARLRALRVAR